MKRIKSFIISAISVFVLNYFFNVISGESLTNAEFLILFLVLENNYILTFEVNK